LKQIRLHEAAAQAAAAEAEEEREIEAEGRSDDSGLRRVPSKKKKRKKKKDRRSHSSVVPSGLASPLHTLHLARDILARVCLSATGGSGKGSLDGGSGKGSRHGSVASASSAKSCENLHVL